MLLDVDWKLRWVGCVLKKERTRCHISYCHFWQFPSFSSAPRLRAVHMPAVTDTVARPSATAAMMLAAPTACVTAATCGGIGAPTTGPWFDDKPLPDPCGRRDPDARHGRRDRRRAGELRCRGLSNHTAPDERARTVGRRARAAGCADAPARGHAGFAASDRRAEPPPRNDRAVDAADRHRHAGAIAPAIGAAHRSRGGTARRLNAASPAVRCGGPAHGRRCPAGRAACRRAPARAGSATSGT
jgi:hypothetical protein